MAHKGALLRRYHDSEELCMAAAAVLSREGKRVEALALVRDSTGRQSTLIHAQLALDAGDARQVSPQLPFYTQSASLTHAFQHGSSARGDFVQWMSVCSIAEI